MSTITDRTRTVVDRTTFTITFFRTLNASREDVFDAWTQPDQIAAWWDPDGERLAACTIQLEIGGSFRFESASGHGPGFSGSYKTIDRPTKLVFEAMGAVGTVELVSEAGATHMRVAIRCPSKAHLEQMLEVGVDVGTERTLDNLVAHLGRRAA